MPVLCVKNTLQGWLKGINGTAVGDGSNDMGQDGLLDRMTVARDVFGLSLHYYDTIGHSDYRAIGDGVAPFAKPNNTDFRSLYNGNIAGMSVNLAALGRASAGVNAEPLFYKYRYDQLNRLVSMRAYKGFNNSTNTWTPVLLDDYREEVRYDANGNILSYIRNGSPEVPDSAKLMDSLTYKYWANTNQLKQVLDEVGYSGNYWADIDNQTETENYVYDAIGNLVQDKAENLTIAWNVYGKIDSIVKPGGTIKYTYDAAGNRISKSYDGKTTVYVRDASGNVMSIYEKEGAGALVQAELHLYGSSRLGLTGKRTADPEAVTLATGFDPGKLITFTRGEKIFELSNHLGNILATINDKKLATDDGNGEVAWYEADVVTANDYYPFGMIMPGRKYAFDDSYRYGFNGKENDNEVKGEGNQQDYGMRIYDPRLGRFLSVDPLTPQYPELTPYQFASNCPIEGIDLDGLEYTSSKHPKVSPYVSYDPELKKITKVSTSLIYQNFIGYSRSQLLPQYGPAGADWQNYESDLRIPFADVDYTINFESDVLNAVAPSPNLSQQLEEVEGGGKTFVYTSPTVNKVSTKFSNSVTRNNGTPGVKVNTVEFPNADKVSAAITVLGIAATGIAALISHDEFVDAGNQSNFIIGTVATKLNSWLSKIPEHYRDSRHLTEIADYLLNGQVPTMIDATGTERTNSDLLKIAKGIWSEIETDRKEDDRNKAMKDRQNYMNRASSDNTTNNNSVIVKP